MSIHSFVNTILDSPCTTMLSLHDITHIDGKIARKWIKFLLTIFIFHPDYVNIFIASWIRSSRSNCYYLCKIELVIQWQIKRERQTILPLRTIIPYDDYEKDRSFLTRRVRSNILPFIVLSSASFCIKCQLVPEEEEKKIILLQQTLS